VKRPAGVRDHRIVCHLGPLLDERGMTLVQLSELTGITVANLSVLKNGRARAIRYTTLTAICTALECEPGDVLGLNAANATVEPQPPVATGSG
jgi:putative transcriptional regulator